MPFHRNVLFAVLAIVIAAAAPAATAATIQLFLDPAGGVDRNNDGASPDRPLKTFQRLEGVIARDHADISGQFVVNIAPGVYNDLSLNWKLEGNRADKRITFRNWERRGGRGPVVFHRNAGGPPTFFTYNRQSTGPAVQFGFHRLTIENYWAALYFNTAQPAALTRERCSSRHSGPHVVGNTFRNLGAKYADGMRKPAYAAIVYRDIDCALIAGNVFQNIENYEDEFPELVHAIYFADGASGSTVRGNWFENISGAIIKNRNFSNNNILTNNVFAIKKGEQIFQDWFQDSRKNKYAKKMKETGKFECASWGNEFSDNRIVRLSATRNTPRKREVFEVNKAGSPPCPQLDRRLRRSGNTRTNDDLGRAEAFFEPVRRDEVRAASPPRS